MSNAVELIIFVLLVSLSQNQICQRPELSRTNTNWFGFWGFH